MPPPDAYIKLRMVLVQLYPNKESATRVAEDAGISIAAVALSERAIDNWHQLLAEARKQNRLARLLEIVSAEYGENPDFRTARQLFSDLVTTPVQPSLAQITPVSPDMAGWHLVHPYPMQPHFSGRTNERRLLTEWLEQDSDHPLLLVRALGGFGKSALTWHWLTHDVDPVRWPQVLWWSFYESNSSFENFLPETLTYLGSDLTRIAHLRQAVDELLRRLTRPGVLLILDGFERALRAFHSLSAAYQGDDPPASDTISNADTTKHATRNTQHDLTCISPLADYFLQRLATLPGLRSKVLLTTRLTPHSLVWQGALLQGCREYELRDLHPADAVALFRSLGVRGNRGEIESACAAYGFHPLSLRLLAGLVLKDLQQPGDIAASRRLDLTGDLVQRQHHVLEQAYTSLPPARRQLLSRLACFRSPVAYEALRAISETATKGKRKTGGKRQTARPEQAAASNVEQTTAAAKGITAPSVDFDADLHDLLERGLVQRDARSGRFDLHPIVRRYAYDRLVGQQRSAAHRRLRDYFVVIEVPERVRTLDELMPLIELYHHTVNAGQYDRAFELFRDQIHNALYYQFGAHQLQIELLRALFPAGEAQPPRLKDEEDQAWTLTALANSYSVSGQPRRAAPLAERGNSTRENRDDKQSLAIGLANLALSQLHIGALRAAEANLRRSIDLCREIGAALEEAESRREVGRLLAYRGAWAEAASELATALVFFEEEKEVQQQGLTSAHQALLELLLVRSSVGTSDRAPVQAALHFAHRALELADETARTRYPVERDYVEAHWLVGAAQRANGDLDAAERHLNEALTRCRTINLVEQEADILLDLARLRRDQGQPAAALALVNEALAITERCGYVLQGADGQLLLAELALAAGQREEARRAAQQARDLAFCDGPPYTYHVAYAEAEALLARLG